MSTGTIAITIDPRRKGVIVPVVRFPAASCWPVAVAVAPSGLLVSNPRTSYAASVASMTGVAKVTSTTGVVGDASVEYQIAESTRAPLMLNTFATAAEKKLLLSWSTTLTTEWSSVFDLYEWKDITTVDPAPVGICTLTGLTMSVGNGFGRPELNCRRRTRTTFVGIGLPAVAFFSAMTTLIHPIVGFQVRTGVIAPVPARMPN